MTISKKIELDATNYLYRIADKILHNEHLSLTERREVFEKLTGEEPTITKRGRPCLRIRDYRMAREYLLAISEGKTNLQRQRNSLIKKYKLSDNDNTFYLALNRGIKILEEYSTKKINEIESGADSKIDVNYYKQSLHIVELYREKNAHLRKQPTSI